MAWKVDGVVEQRLRFIMEWQQGEFGLAELCRQHQITRPTGYKWIERYEAEGLEGLRDRSRAPHEHPNQVGEAVEQHILALKAKYGLWGARKIRARLLNGGTKGVPAASTIGALLRSHGLTVGRKKRSKAPPRNEPLAEADSPNVVWAADFKGWFRTGDGARCDPLTITDGHSRYLLRCQAVKGEDTVHAKPVFEAAFREYGLPRRMRTDNGAPFGSNGDTGLTGLAVWWIKLGIYPERIRPGKPQENGRHERMHLTLKQATASPPARNLRQQQQRFDEFRQEYNEERPHEALGQAPPGSVYTASGRLWPSRVPEVNYGPDEEVRWVDGGGRIRWQGRRVFISHALAGEPVGLQQIGADAWRIDFSFYPLGIAEGKRTRLWTPEQWRNREDAGAASGRGARVVF
jgi:putative transposase